MLRYLMERDAVAAADTEAELTMTAQMARLRLTAAEHQRLQAAVAQIIGYFDQMAALDVAGVQPTTHAGAAQGRLRDDRALPAEQRWPGASRSALLAAAPSTEDRHFSVPNVL